MDELYDDGSELELHDHGSSARRTDPSEKVEQGLVLAANAIWAVVGLVLWLPQIARVLLTSAWRLVHAALTRQSPDSARAPIRRVSRFYVDGFMGWKRPAAGQGMYAGRDLRLRRLLVEAVWAAGFYLLLLRLVAPERFGVAWRWITAAIEWSLDRTAAMLATVWDRLPEGVRELGELEPTVRLALAVVFLLVFAGGYVLGRRR